jgi:parallel beta-helix repeat protein
MLEKLTMRAIQSKNVQRTSAPGRRFRQAKGQRLQEVCAMVIETLEARELLSVVPIPVTNTNDSGSGSLRAAIIAANNDLGADEIDFQIASGPQMIQLSSPLPAITDTLTLNGMTQGGYGSAPLIALDGTIAGFVADGIEVDAPNCVIEGLAVNNFGGEGIHLSAAATGATITRDYLGVMLDGQTAAGNNDGLYVQSSGDTITNNVLSGNNVDGVLFSGASNCTVTGNMIGLDSSGELVVSNFNNGVEVADASSNITIWGNVISGNFGNGIFLDTSSGVTITANVIGLDATGMLDTDPNFSSFGNNGSGVNIGFQSFNNVVGGTHASDANVISNNSGGVRIFTYAPQYNLVEGNIIGLGSDGKTLLGNSGDGVMIVGLGTPQFTISGAVITGNVIAGNFGNGITAKSGATISNNKIGIDAFGDSSVGNFGDGVRIVGSNSTVAQNTIWYNQVDGVSVGAGTGNLITQNSIFANDASGQQAAAGIDLFNGNFYLGPTPNDSAGHTGANNFQNFPAIVSITNDGSHLFVSGTLDSTPGMTFSLEFFSSAAAGPQWYGEGQNYLGSTTVMSDSGGHVSFNVMLAEPVNGQSVLSATASDGANNTSEFSLAGAIPAAPVLTVTTTTLNSALNPAQLGQDVELTATVSSAAATGTVTFMEGTTNLGSASVVNGVATLDLTTLGIGSHSITAVYGGDGSLLTSTSAALTELITTIATTTAIKTSLSPSTLGQNLTLTATLSSAAATGTVTFMEGSATLGAANVVNGVATLDLTMLGVGSHAIAAVYSGDSSYAASTSAALTQVVNKIATTTALSSSVNPSNFAQDVTLTATVSSTTVTGIVTFMDGTNSLGTVSVVNGVAKLDLTTLAVGSHSITAVYTGDGNYAGSSSAVLSQVVKQTSAVPTTTTLATSLNPSRFGDVVTFTATVSSTSATGVVSFTDGTATLGAAKVVNGVATFSVSNLAVGSHSIRATYSGDASFAASKSTALSQSVRKAATSTTLTSSLDPSTIGQAVTFTAALTAGATGTVSFEDGGAVLFTAPLVNGVASYTTSALAAGSHRMVAVYSGDGSYAASTSAAVKQVVNKIATTTMLSSSVSLAAYGQAVTFTATVPISAAATGTMSFRDGKTVLFTTSVVGGQATFTTSALSLGNHAITAAYSGDSTFAASTSAALTQTVTVKTTTTLTSSLNPAASGQKVVFTAAISSATGAPTGTVTFMDGATVLGTANVKNGVASFSISTLSVGNHTITAAYAGNTDFQSSVSAALTQTVSSPVKGKVQVASALAKPHGHHH